MNVHYSQVIWIFDNPFQILTNFSGFQKLHECFTWISFLKYAFATLKDGVENTYFVLIKTV